MLPVFPEQQADLLSLATVERLDYVSPIERFPRKEADVLITVLAETNTTALATIEPARQASFNQGRRSLRETFLRRAAGGELRWSLTLYPTPTYALDAGMATEEFAEFLFAACKLDRPDPIAAWRDLAATQSHLIDRLAGKRQIRIVGPDTDLTLSIEGRSWINSDGHRNFPSGEIFAGPREDSATGRIRFSHPAIAGGREVADVRLQFEQGVVAEASASSNEEYPHRMLDADPGARRLGESAFGTNFDVTRVTKNTLLDEKNGGTVHLALGAGYPNTGSQNRSAIHWDLICDLRAAGRVEVDGETFLADGHYRNE